MKFQLGQVVITSGPLSELTQEDISNALRRHSEGDCGEVSKADKKKMNFRSNVVTEFYLHTKQQKTLSFG